MAGTLATLDDGDTGFQSPDEMDGYDQSDDDQTGTLGNLGEHPSNKQITDLSDFGRSLAGDPKEVRGALEQGQSGIDKATAEKRARIQKAYDILSASGQGNVNLPLFAASGALLGPSRNFGESLSNAVGAAGPLLQQGRQQDFQRASALQRLNIEGADVGVEEARNKQQFLDKRLGMGQQALTTAARLEAQQKQWELNNARAMAQARITATWRKQQQDRLDQLAQQSRYTWQPGLGPDPNDPDKQVSGSIRYATKGDEPPQFFPGAVQTVRPTPKDTQVGATDDPIVQSWVHNVLNGNATMQQVPQTYRNAVSLATADAPANAYSPTAASRFTTAASRIIQNYIKLPQYELTANGLPYLQRIDAAMKTPGSVSDQDLLDSLTKLNTAGNAVTDAQVKLITDGKSFADFAGTIANKFENGGVLSDNQRHQIQDISKAIYANYKKGYQPVYEQVTKQLKASGIPEGFWSLPDLNNLSEQALKDSAPPPSQSATPGQPLPPVQVRNEADYNKLPSGTQYLDPDGHLRTKR